MVVPGGGFAASYDADSEGVEGKFYVWTAAEITDVLGNGEQAAVFSQIYDVTEGGNWEGKTILNRLNALALLNREEEQALDECRRKLFEVREKRKKPGWDDKVLADWNGLAIRAIAIGGRHVPPAGVDRACGQSLRLRSKQDVREWPPVPFLSARTSSRRPRPRPTTPT